jgi:succinate dehydrogenase / fumarate reductase iron-sulfur subunit
MKFSILRSDGKEEKVYEVYEVETTPGMTVLGALFYIQDRLEPDLSFRYSCRGAVCGSCAMLINRFPQLACRTQVEDLIKGVDMPQLKPYPAISTETNWNPKNEILIEPLPHLPVIKDLVVKMDGFYEAYKTVEPYFRPQEEDPEKERLMEPKHAHELENYTNCILCAACFGACPVEAESPEFLGPAAMAKLYRFAIDPREGRTEYRLKLGEKPNGWNACKFHLNCKRVCPKGVPPNMAIGQARSRLKKLKKGKKED